MLQRAIALAALAEGRSRIEASSYCDDVRSAMRAAGALGAVIEEMPGALEVTGGGPHPREARDCGESGLALRMFTALSALFDKEITLEARGTLAA